MSQEPLHLGVALDAAGWHPAAWREPDARPAELFDARYWVDLVREAEAGLLDLVTIEDFDRFSAGALAGVTVVPVMLGGGLQHALAPEVFLKPVLAEIGASMPTQALFLLDADAEAGFAQSATLAQWWAVAGRQLAGRV